MTRRTQNFTSRVCALAACLLLMLGACGGGVETGGTGPTGSAYVEGPITGFGSIVVGGIRFDERRATVSDADDRPFDRANLRLGMVVEVQSDRPGDDGSGGRSATATRVRLGGSLVGPLEAITPGGTFIRVLGQVVRVPTATVFEGVPGGLTGLMVGDVLEVHGFPSPDIALSDLVATRVERRTSAPAQFRVRGIARDVNITGTPPTLRVGTATFDLGASGVPAGLTNGMVVRLTTGTTLVSGRWPVIAAAVESRRLDDRDEAEVEGLVTAFSSATSFSVNGVPVNASSAAFPDGPVSLGARVEVEGRVANGVLVATEVELRSDDEVFNDGIDLRGTLSGLNRTARTFVLRGVTIFYGTVPLPEYVSPATEAALADGLCARVRGRLDADRTRALATRIEFRDSCDP
jgi:hypothetical protein